MSFDAIARLLRGQRPFQLFMWTRGLEQWFFTAGRSDIVDADPDLYSRVDFYGEPDFYERTWQARPGLSHDRIPDASEQERTDFAVTLPLDDAFAVQYFAPVGLVQTELQIWKGYSNDPDGERVSRYIGVLLTAKPQMRAQTIKLVHRMDGLEMSAAGEPYTIQQACPYGIHDARCRLDREPMKVAGTVSAITTDGRTLTIAAAAGEPDGNYKGGVIEYRGWLEAIRDHVGDQVETEAPLPGLVDAFAGSGSEPVTISRGCRQLLSVCDELGNSARYGGFNWMTDNPFDGRNIV